MFLSRDIFGKLREMFPVYNERGCRFLMYLVGISEKGWGSETCIIGRINRVTRIDNRHCCLFCSLASDTHSYSVPIPECVSF